MNPKVSFSQGTKIKGNLISSMRMKNLTFSDITSINSKTSQSLTKHTQEIIHFSPRRKGNSIWHDIGRQIQ